MQIRSRILGAVAFAFASALSSPSFAASWSFQNLTQDDVDKVMREMSANTTMHSVLPPSALGSIFGFELGVVGGRTSSPGIDEIAKRVDASASVGQIIHAGLVGAVTTPIALTVEATYLPTIETTELRYSQYALGLKWTLSDKLIPILPLNLALRGFMAKSELNWKQTQSGVEFKAVSDLQVSGLQLLLSPKLWVVEPYVGVGVASSNGKFTQSGTAPVPIFADSSTEKESKNSTTQLLVGLDVRLLVLGLGVEYMKAFGSDSVTGKLSFKF